MAECTWWAQARLKFRELVHTRMPLSIGGLSARNLLAACMPEYMNLMVVGRGTEKSAAGEAAQACVMPLCMFLCTPVRAPFSVGHSGELTNQLTNNASEERARAAEEVIA